MKNTSVRFGFRATLVLLCCATSAAMADVVKFDIPSQPASTALLAFSRQAAAEVLFASDTVKSVRANTVVGSFEPAEALIRLLADTGLSASRSGNGKWLVITSSASPTVAVASAPAVSSMTAEPVIPQRRATSNDDHPLQMEAME